MECEKIGTSNYYWCFPSKISQAKKTQLEKLRTERQNLERQNADYTAQIEAKAISLEEKARRKELGRELAEAESRHAFLVKELSAYADSDPEVLAQLKRDAQSAKDIVNRWTGR